MQGVLISKHRSLGFPGQRIIQRGALHPKHPTGPRLGHAISQRLTNLLQQHRTDGTRTATKTPERTSTSYALAYQAGMTLAAPVRRRAHRTPVKIRRRTTGTTQGQGIANRHSEDLS